MDTISSLKIVGLPLSYIIEAIFNKLHIELMDIYFIFLMEKMENLMVNVG